MELEERGGLEALKEYWSIKKDYPKDSIYTYIGQDRMLLLHFVLHI